MFWYWFGFSNKFPYWLTCQQQLLSTSLGDLFLNENWWLAILVCWQHVWCWAWMNQGSMSKYILPEWADRNVCICGNATRKQKSWEAGLDTLPHCNTKLPVAMGWMDPGQDVPYNVFSVRGSKLSRTFSKGMIEKEPYSLWIRKTISRMLFVTYRCCHLQWEY